MFLCFFLFFFITVIPMNQVHAQQLVRVGFIPDDGFHTMEVNGGFSGLNYDYLMKVAQYTGWNYEFVVIEENENETPMEKAQQMLLHQEIDLLGSMYLTEENEALFAFGEKNYGIARHTLCVLGNNNKITANNFFMQETLSVALVRDDTASAQAFEFIFLNRDVETSIFYVDTSEEALELLKNEEVDTLMSTDVSVNSNILASLVSASPTPFYFASWKGNEVLLEELDRAIGKIEIAEYTIQQQLVNEYFGQLHTGNIILTQEEAEALADYPYLTVGLLKGREPYQFYNGEEAVPKGISVEILEEISEIIGVEFRYVWLESREEMRDKIASCEIDICSTVPFDSDYELTYFFDVVLTQPYLTNAVAWIHQQGEEKDANPLFYYLADNIPFFPDEELSEVVDVEQALLEVSRTGNYSLFADPYMAQYHIQRLGVQNVEMQSVNSMNSKICFGIGKHLDSTVVGLINHAILHLDPFVMDDIIYNNVTVTKEITLGMVIRENSLMIMTITTGTLGFIIFALVYYTKKLRNISRQDSLTKLYNAGYFHDFAEEKAKKSSDGCLILVDIDYFKQVNDTYGHQMGDTIIILVGKTLEKAFQNQGVVARLGGDEFVVFLDVPCKVDELNQKCEKILKELAHNPTNVPVTLSIGGLRFHQVMHYSVLYRLADEALYKVKEKGRNGYYFSEKGE